MEIHPLCDAGHGLNAQRILEEGIQATA
jgi:hypothetical protein